MRKKNGFVAEFREFIMRGNVLDLAVGVIIGGAFQAIVKSLVDDILMPVISLLTGGIDFNNWFIALGSGDYATSAEANAAGVATLNYGTFIGAVIIFLLVKSINSISNKLKKEEAPVEEKPTTKTCPYCKSEIDISATRCPHCTSELKDSE